MLLYILLAVVLLAVTLVAYAATRPNDFHIHRSARISAPPERIVPYVDDFHEWTAWSPYEGLDPAMQRTYSGAPRGVGAIYQWNGAGKAGEGRMEILRREPQRVDIDLQFTRPFKSRSQTEFLFVPDGAATIVTWGMRGTSPFIMKLFGIFMKLDAMVGKDFEVGLAKLKTLAEHAPAAPLAGVGR